MRNFFFYIAIVFLFCTFQNVQSSVIYFNKKEIALKTVLFNSNEYVEINYLVKILFPNANIKDNSIYLDRNITIKLANSSFFISIKRDDDLNIFQMHLPILYYNNLYYVPLDAFLKALENNQIIKYDKIHTFYFIEDKLFSTLNNIQPILKNINLGKDENEPYKENNLRKQNKKSSIKEQTSKTNDVILEPVYKQSKEENKYSIPDDIKNSIKK